jgi:hypothetical protein
MTTHDELLAKIDAVPNSDSCWKIAIICAVVELHKPQEITLPNGEWGANCGHCDIGFTYPCPTIRAIERELV